MMIIIVIYIYIYAVVVLDLLPFACHMYVLYRHQRVVVCLLRLQTSGSLMITS